MTSPCQAALPQAGASAGIKKKPGAKDLTVLASDQPAAAAGTFTTNQVKAASVKLCMKRIQSGTAQAIVINSGNANACTGQQGITNAERMGSLAADALGIPAASVLVCSTGKIGLQLPMDKLESAIPKAVGQLAASGGLDAAHALMTTDTQPKYCTTVITIDDKSVRITGLVKGAGMIQPNMATMLAFVLTDAAVDSNALQDCLGQSVFQSFNRISVDGDTSTNDTCLCLANGAAGNAALNAAHPDWAVFSDALHAVCFTLAQKIVQDGEGCTRVVTVKVSGAATEEDAEIALRSVGNSIEVKSSWNSNTPGWGRVMHALGYSKAKVVEDKVDIAYDGVPAAKSGLAVDTNAEALLAVVRKDAFTVDINLNLGEGEAVMYATDCTEEYIRLNTY